MLDVRWKGQFTVIKALGCLKSEGITNIEYHLIGIGTGEYIKKMSKLVGVEDQVRIIGALPHEEVMQWMDSVDIYLQPSYQEGLCRSIAEAISRACPVIASEVGGNNELISSDCLFHAGDIKQLVEKIKQMMNKEEQIKYAKLNFEHAHKYQKKALDSLRDEFYNRFMESG